MTASSLSEISSLTFGGLKQVCCAVTKSHEGTLASVSRYEVVLYSFVGVSSSLALFKLGPFGG